MHCLPSVCTFSSLALTLFHAALGLLAQADYDLTPHTEGGGVNFKNLKKICNPRKLSQLQIYLQVFHPKMPLYASNTWFPRTNSKILGHLAQCRNVSNPPSEWE